MPGKTIETIVDNNLQRWIKMELNALPEKIEKEMADPNEIPKDDWQKWFPIDSTVTNSEIQQLEKKISYQLPEDYKLFLQHKHFYELQIAGASFFSHPVNKWKKGLLKKIKTDNPPEYLITKGLISFADYSGWGLLCFDTNQITENNNYPIVLWDHDIPDKTTYTDKNFKELMIRLDKEENKNKG